MIALDHLHELALKYEKEVGSAARHFVHFVRGELEVLEKTALAKVTAAKPAVETKVEEVKAEVEHKVEEVKAEVEHKVEPAAPVEAAPVVADPAPTSPVVDTPAAE